MALEEELALLAAEQRQDDEELPEPRPAVGQNAELLQSLLRQKDRDLVLAAKLGKALLEKNEDLSKQNEKIAEEFSQKLEVGVVPNSLPSLFWKLRAFPTILNRSPLYRTKEVGLGVFFGAGAEHQM